MQPIQPSDLPNPAGHYSVAVEHGGLLYVSGQLPKDPADGSIPPGMEAQTRQVLANLRSVLAAGGSSPEKVLQVRIYIPDMQHWDLVNRVYADFFGDHRPARVVIPTRDLHFGALIELEATAVSSLDTM